jgi:DinB superfamily
MSTAARSSVAEDLAPLSADRVELMAELVRISHELKMLVASLDEAAFNWRPDSGRAWSVGQCIDHLTRVNRIYLDALEEATRIAREQGECPAPPLDPGRLGGWFIRTLEPPVRRRIETPKKCQPASRCLMNATLISFAGEQQRMIELVRSTACVDCNQATFRNPLAYGLSVFRLSAGLLIVPAHERRHLFQARSVVADPDFPHAG